MADVKALIADPEFQGLAPAAQLRLLQRLDPDFGQVSVDRLPALLHQLGGGTTGFVGPRTPPSFGEDFMGTLSKDIVGAPGAIVNSLIHPLETLKSLAAPPMSNKWFSPPNPATQPPEMTPGEMLGHTLGVGVLGGVGKVVPKIVAGVGEGLSDTAKATMSKPAQPGVQNIPSNILRSVARQFAVEPVPEFQARGGGPTVQVKPAKSFEPIAAPTVLFKAQASAKPWPAPSVNIPEPVAPTPRPAPDVTYPAQAPAPTAFRARGGGPTVRIKSIEEAVPPAPIPEHPVTGKAEPVVPKPIPGVNELPPEYEPQAQEFYAGGARRAFDADMKLATHLKTKGVTPESWLNATEENQNALRKEAGLLKFGSGSGARPRPVAVKNVFDRLSELWGR